MIPDIYSKDIFSIDYDKLKKLGYINLFLDVDNTIILYENDKIDTKYIDFINKLKKKGFNIMLFSNSRSKRVLNIAEDLGIKGYYSSMKPLKKNYKRVMKDYDKDTCIFIGDQFMTDVLGAKRMGFKVILVDRMSNKEPIYTRFWRFFEKKLLKKYNKQGKFKIYNYYDNVK